MEKRVKQQPLLRHPEGLVRFNQMKHTNRGFTLVELLVVITIIGILIGLSAFGLAGARESSRDARRKADMELIRSGLELYRSDCNTYPVATWTTNWPSQITGATNPPSPLPSSCIPTNVYINIPLDPASPSRNYSYVSSDGKTFELCASLEQNTSSISCVASCGSTCSYKVNNP